jgi:hypothetical protein
VVDEERQLFGEPVQFEDLGELGAFPLPGQESESSLVSGFWVEPVQGPSRSDWMFPQAHTSDFASCHGSTRPSNPASWRELKRPSFQTFRGPWPADTCRPGTSLFWVRVPSPRCVQTPTVRLLALLRWQCSRHPPLEGIGRSRPAVHRGWRVEP